MMASDRIAALERLGVRFQAREMSWHEMFERLARFRKRFGHARVPITWKQDRRLARWVVKQRSLYRQGKMPEAREKRLAALGFFEGLDADPWDTHYEALRAYHREHGHTRVVEGKAATLGAWVRMQRRLRRQGRLARRRLLSWTPDPALGFWVATQRQRHRRGRLEPERTRALERLGFDWSPPP